MPCHNGNHTVVASRLYILRKKGNGKQSGGDKFSVSKDQSIFDHSPTFYIYGDFAIQMVFPVPLHPSSITVSMLSIACSSVHVRRSFGSQPSSLNRSILPLCTSQIFNGLFAKESSKT
jgi:hypothetical protein